VPRERSERTGDASVAHDEVDYDPYVDGKSRDGETQPFLASRPIDLAESDPDNPPGAETVRGLGDRQDQIGRRETRTDGVEVHQRFRHVRGDLGAGLRRAVSSSAKRADVLMPAGNKDLLEGLPGGVIAGRVRHFGLVVGIEPAGQATASGFHNADVVVADLAELLASP
jgi:hypothetical protein